MQGKLTFSLLLLEAACFFTAPLLKFALSPADAAGLTLMLLPFAVWPLLSWSCGLAAMLKDGFSLAPPIVTALLFVPAALLHYGAGAVRFALIYGGACLMGEATAYPFRVMRLAARGK